MFLFAAYPPEAIPLSFTTTPSTPGPSTTTPNPALATVSCNFDSGLCGFSQRKTDDFDWSRSARGTTSSGTGRKVKTHY